MDAKAVKQYAPLGLIGGSSLLAVLILVFGFGGEQTLVPIEVHFGMQIDASAGPAQQIWANAPLPTHIKMKMFNVSKKEKDGTITPDMTLLELFPTDGEPGCGIGFAKFSMTLIKESEQPTLNLTMNMVPMVYRKEVEAGKMETFIMWFMASVVNNWTVFTWGLILIGIGLVGIGVALLLMDKKNKNLAETIVTPILQNIK